MPPKPAAATKTKPGRLTSGLIEAVDEAIAEGRTSYEVARAAGIEPSALSRFRSGERSLDLRSADKLAATLGLGIAKVAKRGRGRPGKACGLEDVGRSGEDSADASGP